MFSSFLKDSDLKSALLLEQAAHCYLKLRSPMPRKYSFHMILAGHRFSKAGQASSTLQVTTIVTVLELCIFVAETTCNAVLLTSTTDF